MSTKWEDAAKWTSNHLSHGATFLVLLGIASPVAAVILTPDSQWTDRGSIGDLIAGTSVPLLTLASFLLVFSALRAQQEDLSLTRKEMREARYGADLQRFENTFFGMLRLHHEHVASMLHASYPESEEKAGRGVFLGAINRIGRLSALAKKADPHPSVQFMELVVTPTREELARTKPMFAPYFAHLVEVLRLVSELKVPGDDNKQRAERARGYYRIVRAQLSPHEKGVIVLASLHADYVPVELHTLCVKGGLMEGFDPTGVLISRAEFDRFLEGP